MFSFSLKRNAIPFTEKEDLFTKELLRLFRDRCQKEGAFIHQMNLDKYEFFWSPYMAKHLDDGIMGCWDPGTRWKIFLLPNSITVIPEQTKYSIADEKALSTADYLLTDVIAQTLVHELNHAWQFSISPVLWIINRLVTIVVEHIPFLNKITLEHDVDKHISDNKEVTEFFQTLYNCWSAYVYLRRCEMRLQRMLDESSSKEDVEYANDATINARIEFMKYPEHLRRNTIYLLDSFDILSNKTMLDWGCDHNPSQAWYVSYNICLFYERKRTYEKSSIFEPSYS